jgi:Zn-dependent peptidase ImmA (M78 family)
VLSAAEKLLQSYGIQRPEQIDLEAIAFDRGAFVTYKKLDGCDARIVGHGKKAIITVSTRSSSERQRFSIGHELGHWEEDWRGGGGFLCAQDDIRDSGVSIDAKRESETRANRFASDLMLPGYLFTPACARQPLTLDTCLRLAKDFRASVSATAIKLVKVASYPGMITCYSARGREWYVSGPGLPDYFPPLKELHQDTDAFELLYTEGWGTSRLLNNDGACWIDRNDAKSVRLKEQSIKITKDRVLTILWFQNLP